MPGSHGSITKAGKVRDQTPKVESHRPPKKIPRIRNNKNYLRRILGKESFEARKRGRRRR
ncbi:MAG: 30S ribosomal protein S30e [Candidatus Ranarchaeia archaeon]